MVSEISRLVESERFLSLQALRLYGTPVADKPGVYDFNGHEYYSAALLDAWQDDTKNGD